MKKKYKILLFVGRMGWLLTHTMTKRKKNNEKSEKGPKSAKNENFGKRKKKTFLPIAINNIYSKN